MNSNRPFFPGVDNYRGVYGEKPNGRCTKNKAEFVASREEIEGIGYF